MPEDKLPIPEFAKRIKQKYPEYRDIDDTTLVQKIVAKYPEYASQVEMNGSGQKKKDNSTQSSGLLGALGSAFNSYQNGGAVGSSNPPSKTKADYVRELMAKHTPIKVESNDPLLDATQAAQAKRFQLESTQSDIDPLERVRGLREVKQAQEALKNPFTRTEAIQVLGSGKFKQGSDRNLTLEKAKQTFDESEKVVAPFKDIPAQEQTNSKDLIYEAAIQAYGNLNPTFKKQLQAVRNGSTADSRFTIGGAKTGQIMDVMLNNPHFVDFIQNERPELLPQIQKVSDDLIFDNKEYGKAKLANEISKEMQKTGYNNIDPIFNIESEAKKTGDVIANGLFANDPKKQQFYQENKDEVLDMLDAPSLFEGVASGGKHVFGGIKNTFTEPFTTTSEAVKNNWEKEATNVSADPKGVVKFLRDSGQALGFVGALAGTSGAFGGLSMGAMGAKTANVIGTVLTFFGDQLEEGKVKYPNSPAKAVTSAVTNTSLFAMLSSDLFPAAKVMQAFNAVKPEAATVVSNLTSGAITREAARRELNSIGKQAIGILTKGTEKNVKATAEIVGLTKLNAGLDKLMMDDETYNTFHGGDDDIEIGKTFFLSNIFVNGLAAYGQNKAKNNIVKESLYNAASNPKHFDRLIDDMAIKDPSIKAEEMKENLAYITKAKEALDAGGVPEKQQKEFLFQALKQKGLEVAMESMPEATIQRNHKEQIREAEKVKEDILKGEYQEPVPESEKVLLDKIKKNESLGAGEKDADLAYFRDKAGEDPVAFEERFGGKIATELLEQIPTEKLKENRDFLAKINEENPSVKYLDDVIAEREPAKKPQGAAAVTMPGEMSKPNVVELVKPVSGETDLSYIETNRTADADGTPVSTHDIKNKNEIIGKVEVYENPDGYTFSWVELEGDKKGKGIGKQVYKDINKQSLEATGKPLRSKKETLNESSQRVWESLVKSGEAEIGKDGNFVFKDNAGKETSNESKEGISVYHGSAKDFEGFSSKNVSQDLSFGSGIYFTDDKPTAKTYGDNVYSTTLHKGKSPSEYDYLKWEDKPSGTQLQKIRNAEVDGKKVTIPEENDLSGQEIYKEIAKQLGGEKEASAFLLNAGIDGIKFNESSLIKRGGARKSDEGKSNYVVFDEKAITVNEKESASKATEKSIEPAQPIESKEEVPPNEPPNKVGGEAKEGDGEEIRLSHADTEKIYTELGLPLRADTPTKKREELVQEAQDKIKKGYDFDKTAKEVMAGEKNFDDVDQAAFAIKVTDLKNKQSKLKVTDPEFDALQDQIERYSRASDVAGTISGRALQARRTYEAEPETISDFITAEKESLGVDELTPAQKEKVQKEFDDLKAANEALDKKNAELQAKYEALQAQKEIKKATPSTKTKKTAEDFKKERADIVEAMREKLKKARQDTNATIVPYAKELIAIAPEVAKMVRSLAEQGVVKLEEVIDRVHEILKPEINEITKDDVRRIIAGNYNEKKKTRNELTEQLRDWRDEAKMIEKLEALLRGEEPKNEKARIKRNREITDLREKIKDISGFEAEVERQKQAKLQLDSKNQAANSKDLDKAEKEIDKLDDKERKKKLAEAEKERKALEREFEKEKRIEERNKKKAQIEAARQLEKDLSFRTPEEKALDAIKTRTKKQINEIQTQIDEGKFSVPEKKETLLDKEAVELKDKLIALKKERVYRVMKQIYQNQTKSEKAMRGFAEILNLPRSLMATLDLSAVLRQGLIPSASRPKLLLNNIETTRKFPFVKAEGALAEMFKSVASEKSYDRWFFDLEKTPRFKEMQDSKLALTDSTSPELRAREEEYMSNLAEKFPVIGRTLKFKVAGRNMKIPGANLVKKSERAYSMFLNKLRVDMYNRFADAMEERGVTIRNNPEAYEKMAAYINSATGRGNLPKALNGIAPILNGLFFSPRLIASRLNMLTYMVRPSISKKKGGGISIGLPELYTKFPREVRNAYFKDMIKFLAVGVGVLALAKAAGADVEDDPTSSDFGKIKQGNTRWDIWGGFQPYARVAAQVALAQRKSTNTGKIYELNGEGAFGATTADPITSFIRGKLAPVPSLGLDMLLKRKIAGQKLTSNWNSGTDARGKHEVGIKENLLSHFAPLIATGTAEAMQDRGIKALFDVGIPSLFGVGTQVYQPNQPSDGRKTRKEDRKEKPRKERKD